MIIDIEAEIERGASRADIFNKIDKAISSYEQAYKEKELSEKMLDNFKEFYKLFNKTECVPVEAEPALKRLCAKVRNQIFTDSQSKTTVSNTRTAPVASNKDLSTWLNSL